MKPLSKALSKKKEQIEEVQNNLRFTPLHPTKTIQFDEWRGVLVDNFPDLTLATEIGLSVIAQLLIKDIQNPFGLIYVDVPSSGKTTLLGFFSDLDGVTLQVDNFTPASFVSHSAKKKESELGKIDLLPRIRYRTLILPDLAPVFSKREDDRNMLLGILTRVMDGRGLETNSGVHGSRGYRGEYPFMLLGASTPISNAVWRSMGNLGQRLFFLKIRSAEKTTTALANQLRNPVREKERSCKEATGDFIKTLWESHPKGIEWETGNEDQTLLESIGIVASMLAMSRGTTQEQGDQITSMCERPDRINQWLYNLARGHAIIQARDKINWADIGVILRVAIDSMPNNRSICLLEAIKNNGKIGIEALMKASGYSKPYTLKIAKEMVALGILEEIRVKNDDPGRPSKTFIIPNKLSWLYSNIALGLLKELIN